MNLKRNAASAKRKALLQHSQQLMERERERDVHSMAEEKSILILKVVLI